MARMIAAKTVWLLLSIALLALPCGAQPGPGSPNLVAGISLSSHLTVADCAAARDPARCLATQQARKDCQGKRRSAKRRCLREKLPPPDCSLAPNPQRCLAQQQAQAACQGKAGKELRSCLRNSSGN